MPTSRKLLCAAYIAIAIAALIGTGSQNLAYFNNVGGFLKNFVLDTKVTAASRSIMIDVLFLTLAAMIFMVIEARNREIPYVWAYVAVGGIVAISVAFPLFLLARELRAQATDPARLKAVDAILLAVLGVLMTAAAVYIAVA